MIKKLLFAICLIHVFSTNCLSQGIKQLSLHEEDRGSLNTNIIPLKNKLLKIQFTSEKSSENQTTFTVYDFDFKEATKLEFKTPTNTQYGHILTNSDSTKIFIVQYSTESSKGIFYEYDGLSNEVKKNEFNLPESIKLKKIEYCNEFIFLYLEAEDDAIVFCKYNYLINEIVVLDFKPEIPKKNEFIFSGITYDFNSERLLIGYCINNPLTQKTTLLSIDKNNNFEYFQLPQHKNKIYRTFTIIPDDSVIVCAGTFDNTIKEYSSRKGSFPTSIGLFFTKINDKTKSAKSKFTYYCQLDHIHDFYSFDEDWKKARDKELVNTCKDSTLKLDISTPKVYISENKMILNYKSCDLEEYSTDLDFLLFCTVDENLNIIQNMTINTDGVGHPGLEVDEIMFRDNSDRINSHLTNSINISENKDYFYLSYLSGLTFNSKKSAIRFLKISKNDFSQVESRIMNFNYSDNKSILTALSNGYFYKPNKFLVYGNTIGYGANPKKGRFFGNYELE